MDAGGALAAAKPDGALDAPLSADALIRPWRTATLVASLVAAVELVLLIGLAVLLLAKPLAHAVRRHAEAAALAPAKPKHVVAAKKLVLPLPRLAREQVGVLVLNGNGRAGAASSEASTIGAFGYTIRATGNAGRQDYATTVAMFRRGYEPEARRLAHDMHIKVVGPLDGLKTSALHGAQVAVVLGAR